MTIFQTAILGFVQGLTEFLPISSSGHLVIFQHFLHFQGSPLVLDSVLHLGTLLAILIYFFPTFRHLSRNTLTVTLIGTFPTAVVGLFIHNFVDTLFSSLIVVGFGLFITATFLLLTQNLTFGTTPLAHILPKQAIIIGLIQALAIIPGISRSGSTLVAGLIMGLTRPAAFTYSFYLAIPAITGAFVMELPQVFRTPSSNLTPLLIGFVTATLGGLGSIWVLRKALQRLQLSYFGYYCLIIGALTLLFTVSSP